MELVEEELIETSGSGIGALSVTLLLFVFTNAIAYGLQKALNYKSEYNRFVAGLLMILLYFIIKYVGGFEYLSAIARFGVVEIVIGALNIASTFIKVPQLLDPEGSA